MSQRTCSLPDCGLRHHGRGLCKKHWKREYGKRVSAGTWSGYLRTCETCGRQWRTARWEARFCMRLCYAIAAGWPLSCDLPWRRCPRCDCWWIKAPGDTAWCHQPTALGEAYCSEDCRTRPQPQVFVAGPCARCRTQFVAPTWVGNARYCSARCYLAEHRWRAKSRRHGGPSTARRLDTYMRDAWRCQLCRRKVLPDKQVPHPRAPTIDHIIPVAAGGKNTPENWQTACFACNSRKGQRAAPNGDQLRLI